MDINEMNKINETAKKLLQYIEGVECYESQKKDIGESIKEIFHSAKSSGFDVPTLKKVIAMRKLSKDALSEQEYLMDTYKEALGMV
jgi:uncharacterized protein (UPF0335 family)